MYLVELLTLFCRSDQQISEQLLCLISIHFEDLMKIILVYYSQFPKWKIEVWKLIQMGKIIVL